MDVGQSTDTHGQCWKGESVEESIDLCKYQFIEPFFRKYLPRDGKILEAGCGLGRWVFHLHQRGYDIVGIDLASDALRIVKEYDPDVPIFAVDILHTRFPDKHFTAMISLGVVEHFEEGPQRALAEARRLLKDDGLLFITVPIANVNRRLIVHPLKTLKHCVKNQSGSKYAFEEYRYSVDQFTSLLRSSNFEILECVPDDFSPPKNIGLYVDYYFLRHSRHKWELNAIGNALRALLNYFSPWFACSGALWICRKR